MEDKDPIIQQAEDLGFSDKTIQEVQEHLKNGEAEFMVIEPRFFNDEKDKVFYNLQVGLDYNDAPELKGYHATLINLPEIVHQKMNGVDSAKLEEIMKTTDFSKNSPFLNPDHPDHGATVEKVEKILSDLELLSQRDGRGGIIRDRLEAKYFSHTVFEECIRDPKKTKGKYQINKFFKHYKNPTKENPTKVSQSITTDQAYHLMKNRMVHRYVVNKFGEGENKWVGLDHTKKDQSGNKAYVYVSDFDIVKLVESSPFPGIKQNIDDTVNRLRNGEELSEIYRGDELKLSVDAKYKAFKIFDAEGNIRSYKQIQLTSADPSKSTISSILSNRRPTAENPNNGNPSNEPLGDGNKPENDNLSKPGPTSKSPGEEDDEKKNKNKNKNKLGR